MNTLLSPGVAVVEKDFTSILPATATGIGAIAGRFSMGPINAPVLVSTEDELAATFGKPNSTNYAEWFTAAQFLQYTNSLYVVRAVPTGATNANTTGSASVTVLNSNEYGDASLFTPTERTNSGPFVAKDVGSNGNHLGVIMVDADTWEEFVTWSTTNVNNFPNKKMLSDYFTSAPGTSTFVTNKAVVQSDNKKDELHVLVLDVDGHITGTRWTILEKYEGLSKASDAVNYLNKPIYYVNAINQNSKYLWWSAAPSTTSGGVVAWGASALDASASSAAFASLACPTVFGDSVLNYFYGSELTGASAGSYASPDGGLTSAYDTLKNKDLYDANLFMTAAHSTTVVRHVVENVVYYRKDSMGFVSPNNDGAPIFDTNNTPEQLITTYTTSLSIGEQYAQYAVCDTGWKYIFDRYSSVYRWVPLNGDIAGLCAQVDTIADPWWSPAGFNRGGVKNVIKLAFNPDQTKRDYLYPKGINPVVSFPGQGVVLFGDRTMTLKPSAFDRINVRRLFNVLEKSISKAAKYQLFEFNDPFTRAQFKNMVEPFLRGIQAGRGITDFLVVCDATNNTGTVVDANEFKADIYVRPSRSINFITLSFVATRSDVAFSTAVGG